MASVIRNQNISIQPLKVTCSSTCENKFVLSNDENLTQDDIDQKSTSDKTKRRVAHIPKHPVPGIKNPTPMAEKQENPRQKKPKQKKPKTDTPKKVQNLGTQHMKMKKLRNFIATIPWAYSDTRSGRNFTEKRKSDDPESTSMTAKKPKTNRCNW